MFSTNNNFAKLQNIFDLPCGMYNFLLKKENQLRRRQKKPAGCTGILLIRRRLTPPCTVNHLV